MCISEISNNIAKRENVSVNHLDYIGVMDASMMKQPRMIYNFNVMDKNHPRYKSTIAWSVKIHK